MQQQVRRFTDTHLRGGDRLVRYSAVYGAYAGSIPVRRATSLSLSSSRPRTLTSQARDRGFKSHQGRHGVKLDWSTEGGLSSRYRPVRFRLALPKFRASSLNWRSTRLLTERTGFDSLEAHQVVPDRKSV